MMTSSARAMYDKMDNDSSAHNETNDCTVMALAASTGLDYDVCHAALAKLGRKNRKGCSWRHLGPMAAKYLGFNMRPMMRGEYRAKTMITAERDRKLRSGNYAVLVRGHVAAMVDGKIIDWAQGRRHRIKVVYEVTKMANAPAPAPATPKRTLPNGSANWRAYRKYNKQDNFNLFD